MASRDLEKDIGVSDMNNNSNINTNDNNNNNNNNNNNDNDNDNDNNNDNSNNINVSSFRRKPLFVPNFKADTSGRQRICWSLSMIVAANLIVFIAVMFVNNCPKNDFSSENCTPKFLGRISFQPLRENPLLGPSSNTLITMGALQWDKVVHFHQGWRLFTCIWLHAGVIHVFCNMLTLVFIGIRLEQQYGFVRIGILYLASGIGGSVLSSLFLQQTISIGASGAVFGILGAMLSEILVNWTIYSHKVASLITLVFMVVLNLAAGILPHVDNFAHLGGFLSGFLLGFVLLLRPQLGWRERHELPEHLRVKTKYLPYQLVLIIVAFAVLIAGYTVGFIMLYKGKDGNDYCKWCHYLNCVPTKKWHCN